MADPTPDLRAAARDLMLYADECELILQRTHPGKAAALRGRISAVAAALAAPATSAAVLADIDAARELMDAQAVPSDDRLIWPVPAAVPAETGEKARAALYRAAEAWSELHDMLARIYPALERERSKLSELYRHIAEASAALPAAPAEKPADTGHLNCLEARKISRAYAICEPCNTGNPDGCLWKTAAGVVGEECKFPDGVKETP